MRTTSIVTAAANEEGDAGPRFDSSPSVNRSADSATSSVSSREATPATRLKTRASSSSYEQGGTLELHFPDGTVTFTIAELIPESRVVWRCITSDNPWFETDVVFDFEARGTTTTVRFDHLGWPEVSDLFRDCSMSWAYFLESLRSLIEDGRGTPEEFNE